MKLLPRDGWLLVLAMAAAICSTVSIGRLWLRDSVRDRLAQRLQQRISALTQQQAALLVRKLAKGDAEWLDALVVAAADERPPVAAAAAAELLELVNRWADRPEQNSAQVADLARLLAQQAPRMPAGGRHLAQLLAQRIIDWPLDGHHVDAALLIADCRSVLLLPRVEGEEPRLAALVPPASSKPTEGEPQPAARVLSAPGVPVTSPATPSSPQRGDTTAAAPPSLPAPLPDANREVPQQPRSFNAVSPMRISDE